MEVEGVLRKIQGTSVIRNVLGRKRNAHVADTPCRSAFFTRGGNLVCLTINA